jgi:hypothetical protein
VRSSRAPVVEAIRERVLTEFRYRVPPIAKLREPWIPRKVRKPTTIRVTTVNQVDGRS